VDKYNDLLCGLPTYGLKKQTGPPSEDINPAFLLYAKPLRNFSLNLKSQLINLAKDPASHSPPLPLASLPYSSPEADCC
jgi:hypothetical protein